MSIEGCTRRQFLGAVPIGLGGAAVAGALLPLLGGCEGSAATDGAVVAVNNVASLSFAQFPALSQVGGTALVDVGGAPIAVARVGADAALALSAICTHAGCTVSFASGASGLHCGCHGSSFSSTGAVTSGPARTSLPTFPATVTSVSIDVRLA